MFGIEAKWACSGGLATGHGLIHPLEAASTFCAWGMASVFSGNRSICGSSWWRRDSTGDGTAFLDAGLRGELAILNFRRRLIPSSRNLASLIYPGQLVLDETQRAQAGRALSHYMFS